MNVTKTYRLGRKKAVIIDYLTGKITQAEAGQRLGVQRQTVPTMTNAIFRHLAATKQIDIKSLLKNY